MSYPPSRESSLPGSNRSKRRSRRAKPRGKLLFIPAIFHLEDRTLLAVDYWVDARNIALDLDDPAWADTNNIPDPKVPQLAERPLAFIYRSNDAGRRATLERMYPGGSNQVMPQSHRDRNFSVFLVR